MAKTQQDKLAGTHRAKLSDVKGDDHLVWDLPLRLFHWMLVICVFGAICSAKAEVLDVHRHFGMAVMGLICFRLIWGVVGSRTARFSQFVRPPSEALAVISQIFRGEADKRAGHSALGGYAVILLLLICLVMSLSGAFSTDDVLFEGPFVMFAPTLSPVAERIHAVTENLIFAIILLHLAAMAVYYFRLKKNLIPAMVTGKHKNLQGDSGYLSRPRTILGLLGLAICVLGFQLPILLQPALY